MPRKKPWYEIILVEIGQRIRSEMFCRTDIEVIEKYCALLGNSEITEGERGSILASLDRILMETPKVPAFHRIELCISSLRRELISE